MKNDKTPIQQLIEKIDLYDERGGINMCTLKSVLQAFRKIEEEYLEKIKMNTKLFCVCVTDPNETIGLDSPMIFHIKCEYPDQAIEKAEQILMDGDEYNIEDAWIPTLDLFAVEVTGLDIIEVD